MQSTVQLQQHTESYSAPDEPDMTAVRASQCLCRLLFDDPSLWAHVRLNPSQMPSDYAFSVFSALMALHQQNKKPDRATLADAIRATKRHRGLESALVSWTLEESATPANLDIYQATIEEAHQLRQLKEIRLELDEHIEIGDATGALETLTKALTVAAPKPQVVTIKDALMDVFRELEDPTPALPLGLAPLDNMLDGGIRPGELMVVAGRPGGGKSAFALQVILNAARQGVGVAVWTLEMSARQWTQRAIVSLSMVPLRALRGREQMGSVDEDHIRIAAAELHTLPIYLADTLDTTPDGWRLQASRMVREHGAGLLVIDYLQLMQPDRKAHNREQEVARMTRMVKRATIELNVPIILLAQLNRDAENKVPTLANLRESGAIEQDANQVFFIHREIDQDTRAYKDNGLGVLAKNRDGESGAFPIRYNRQYFRFDAVTDREEPGDLCPRNRRSMLRAS